MYEEPLPEDYSARILKKWEEFLIELPDGPDAESRWELISSTLASENDSGWIWRTLQRAARRPDFYSNRLWTFLTFPRILFGRSTRTAAINCVRSFANYLDADALNQIQTTALSTLENIQQCISLPINEEDFQWRRAAIYFLRRHPMIFATSLRRRISLG